MSQDYTVFISHAGEDKSTIAIPLFHALHHRGVPAFVDQTALPHGENAPQQMIRNMHTAPVGVFILSHHFLAKKWPMKELLCFLDRVDTARNQQVKAPLLIPVFYRMTVQDCTSPQLFKAEDHDGKSIFEHSGFNDRCEAGETSRAQVRTAISRLSKYTGIENNEAATNQPYPSMAPIRTRLVHRIAAIVADATSRHCTNPPPSPSPSDPAQQPAPRRDSFSPYFLDSSLSHEHILDFTTNTRTPQGLVFTTAEGKLKHRLMSTLPKPDDDPAAAPGKFSPHATVAIGMGGVGKSTAIIGIAWESDVRKAFSDGIFLISAGPDATEDHLLREISRAVEASGGDDLAARIRAAPDLAHAVDRAKPWFHGKKILLLLDNLWEAEPAANGFFEDLQRLVPPQGRLLITTRNKAFGKAARRFVYFHALHPTSDESRRMLLRYADLEDGFVSSEETDVSRHLSEILVRCAGLPLALEIAGRAIRDSREQDGASLEEALEACCVDIVDGEYDDLRLTVDISLQAADRWFAKQSLLNCSHGLKPPSELYERLAVLLKQSRVSAAVLSRLWGTNGTVEARMIAEKFCALSLLSKEVRQYKIHDLLMELCISKATCKRRLQSYHDELLKAFSYLPGTSGRSCWWDEDVDCDDYLRENLARHLVGSHRVDELHRLLVNARWAMHRIRGGNYLLWQSDFSEFLCGIERMPRGRGGEGSKWQSRRSTQGMRLVERAVSLAWDRLQVNESELGFQMLGRLGNQFGEFPDVCEFLESIGENASRAWLKPEQRCLPGPESAIVFTSAMESAVDSVDLDDAGERVYVGFKGGIAAVDLESHENKTVAKGVAGRKVSLAVSGSGRRVVSTVCKSGAQVWEWDGEALRAVGKGLETEGGVGCVAVSRDGRRIAAGGLDGAMLVWEGEDVRLRGGRLEGHGGVVTCVAMREDGGWIAFGSRDGSVRLWDVEGMCGKGAPLWGHEDEVRCVDMAGDGRVVVSGSADRTVRVWDAEGMRQVGEGLKGHSRGVLCVAVARDGGWMVSGSSDKTLRVWDVGRMCRVGEALEGHTRWVSSVAISRDGGRIVSGSGDKTVRVWDARHVWGRGRGDGGVVCCVSLFRGDVGAGAGAGAGAVDVAGRGVGRAVCEKRGVPYGYRRISCVGVSKDGGRIGLGFWEGTVRVWDVEEGRDVSGGRGLTGHSGGVSCVEWSEDGRRMVSGSWDGRLCMWDVEGMEGIWGPETGHDRKVECVAMSRDGRWVVSVGRDIVVWEWEKEREREMGEVGRVRGVETKGVTHVRMSWDGERIVTCSKQRVVRVWETRSLRQVGSGFVMDRSIRRMRVLEGDVVVCVSQKKNLLFQLHRDQGLVQASASASASASADGTRVLLEYHGREVWMELPQKRVIGKLEDWIWGSAFVQASGLLVTYQRSGRVTTFRLVGPVR